MSSRKSKRILDAVLLLISLALLVPVFLYWRNNPVSRQNRLIRDARQSYESREYLQAYKSYQRLIDSLEYTSDPASLNYANAGLLTSEFIKTGLRGTSSVEAPESDSVSTQIADKSFQLLLEACRSTENSIASTAFNQLGYTTIKAGEASGENEVDNKLAEGLNYFKEALRKNPGNENARHNYELIKKIYGFPETTLAETRALVAQQRYREAAALLENGMQRDVRLRSQKELLTRIRSVIKIDSTFRSRTL